jgi:hypothetical protein
MIVILQLLTFVRFFAIMNNLISMCHDQSVISIKTVREHSLCQTYTVLVSLSRLATVQCYVTMYSKCFILIEVTTM